MWPLRLKDFRLPIKPGLRCKPFLDPDIFFFPVDYTVVKPENTILPELKPIGYQTESSPVRRFMYTLSGKIVFEILKPRVKIFSVGNN